MVYFISGVIITSTVIVVVVVVIIAQANSCQLFQLKYFCLFKFQ